MFSLKRVSPWILTVFLVANSAPFLAVLLLNMLQNLQINYDCSKIIVHSNVPVFNGELLFRHKVEGSEKKL